MKIKIMDIKDIKTGKATLVIFTSLTLFVPGSLGLFFLRNDLFISMDFAKLLLLSISLSVPFLLLSFILGFFTLEVLLVTPAIKSTEETVYENTEHQDLGLIFLTNIFSIITWVMVGVGFWIFGSQTDNMDIAKQIAQDYLSCTFIIFVILLLLKLLKKHFFKKINAILYGNYTTIEYAY